MEQGWARGKPKKTPMAGPTESWSEKFHHPPTGLPRETQAPTVFKKGPGGREVGNSGNGPGKFQFQTAEHLIWLPMIPSRARPN